MSWMSGLWSRQSSRYSLQVLGQSCYFLFSDPRNLVDILRYIYDYLVSGYLSSSLDQALDAVYDADILIINIRLCLLRYCRVTTTSIINVYEDP
jgi:hypothetical protein